MSLLTRPGILAIIAIVLLSLPALFSLAKPGFYTNHDGETHTARIAQYYQALADGQIPPRFAGTLYNGLGSPILTYIYPLPYLAGSFVHTIGFSFTDSFEIVMSLGFIFSGIFSYLWLKEITKSEKAAFLGALFYIWVPYRFLIIYVRGSISENTAYTFLPLVLYCLTKLFLKNNVFWIAATALSSSLFLLSQNLVALMFSPIIGAYILLIGIFKKSPRFLLASLIAGFWAASIASVTYLPAILERKFVRFDEVYALTYLDHFVSVKQLIHSPWGYGFSLTGFDDLMSFQIGLAHLLVVVIFLLVVAFQLLTKRKIFNNLFFLTAFFILTALATIILMIPTDATIFAWREFKPLARIDYPWRLLGVTTFAISFIAAYIAKIVKPGLFFIFLVLAVVIANRNHIRINKQAIFDDNFFLNYHNTATQLGEFTPKWRQTTRVPIGFDPNLKVQTITGQAEIADVKYNSKKISFIINAISEKTQVRINKFYFPGLTVTDGEKKLILGSDLIITEPGILLLDQEQDGSGLVLLNLEKGRHEIKANWGETNLRLFANFLSLTALILALGAIAKNVKK